jgi:hypothetical protein
VLALVAAHPDSAKVRAQAAEFVDAHPELLARLLTEAASPGSMQWAPGDEELEQAALAVRLASGLPQLLASDGGAAAGRGAALRRPLLALWPALCGDDARSGSPIVARVRRDREALLDGPARLDHEERQQVRPRGARVFESRAALGCCFPVFVSLFLCARRREIFVCAPPGDARRADDGPRRRRAPAPGPANERKDCQGLCRGLAATSEAPTRPNARTSPQTPPSPPHPLPAPPLQRLLTLRCGLARQLRALVSPQAVAGSSGAVASSELLRCVGLHSQVRGGGPRFGGLATQNTTPKTKPRSSSQPEQNHNLKCKP